MVPPLGDPVVSLSSGAIRPELSGGAGDRAAQRPEKNTERAPLFQEHSGADFGARTQSAPPRRGQFRVSRRAGAGSRIRQSLASIRPSTNRLRKLFALMLWNFVSSVSISGKTIFAMSAAALIKEHCRLGVARHLMTLLRPHLDLDPARHSQGVMDGSRFAPDHPP